MSCRVPRKALAEPFWASGVQLLKPLTQKEGHKHPDFPVPGLSWPEPQ